MNIHCLDIWQGARDDGMMFGFGAWCIVWVKIEGICL